MQTPTIKSLVGGGFSQRREHSRQGPDSRAEGAHVSDSATLLMVLLPRGKRDEYVHDRRSGVRGFRLGEGAAVELRKGDPWILERERVTLPRFGASAGYASTEGGLHGYTCMQ